MSTLKQKGNIISRLLWVCLASVFLICGCSTKTEMSDDNEEEPVSSEVSETFYKLQVQKGTLDEAEICSMWIPSFDAAKVISTSNAEGVAKQITVDGVTYSWIINENTFTGYCDRSDFSTADEETAKQLGAQFVENLGYQTHSVPFVSTDERGVINLKYTFQYDGVEILGDKILYIGREDENGTRGTYLSLDICDSGIYSLYISNFMQITSIVATYQKDTDFIGNEQAISLTESYYDQLVGESGAYSAQTDRTEIKIIYMPYLENGNSVLIPVYEVTALSSDGDSCFCAVLDALTGYVYSAQ